MWSLYTLEVVSLVKNRVLRLSDKTTSKAQEKTRILILGGGFSGINAMQRLEKKFARNESVEMMLISEENFLLFTPMLSEVAIGAVDSRHILTPIRDLCHKTMFYRAQVIHIDLKSQKVDLYYNGVPRCLDSIHYDHLVLALGSTTNTMHVPGADQYAFKFKEIGDAILIRNHVVEMFELAETSADPDEKDALLTFSIIGGGDSGVEIAAAIQSFARRIQTLYPTIKMSDIQVHLFEAQERILATLPEELASYAQKQLESMGVYVHTSTRVQEVHGQWVVVGTEQKLPTYTTIWATGVAIPDLIQSLPVEKDAKGRPINTSELRLPGYDNVWAIGDNILTPLPEHSGFYPPTAQSAIQEGHHVAENIARVLQHQEPLPFHYQQKGEMVVLGENAAVAMVYGKKLKGFPAWIVWRAFYLMRLPKGKKRIRVLFDWILNLFGPMDTTQLKLAPRNEPIDSTALPFPKELFAEKEA